MKSIYLNVNNYNILLIKFSCLRIILFQNSKFEVKYGFIYKSPIWKLLKFTTNNIYKRKFYITTTFGIIFSDFENLPPSFLYFHVLPVLP